MITEIKQGGGPITTSVRVLRQHPSTTTIKRWRKTPAGAWQGDGIIKKKEDADGVYPVGDATAAAGKLIEWQWSARQPPGNSEDALVEYAVFQDGKRIGFLQDTIPYPADKLVAGKLSCELKVAP